MASELIKELYNNEKNISFIWIAPGNLKNKVRLSFKIIYHLHQLLNIAILKIWILILKLAKFFI